MVSKYFAFVSILSVTIFAQNQDWSCETINGGACTGNGVTVSPVDPTKDPYLNATMGINCTDARKQGSTTSISSGTILNNENVTLKIECLDQSTPCIKDFQLCIQDPNVPAITLKCRYINTFNQTANTKCGENGAKKKTYWMRSGFGATKIDYSNEEIHVAKNITSAQTTGE